MRGEITSSYRDSQNRANFLKTSPQLNGSEKSARLWWVRLLWLSGNIQRRNAKRHRSPGHFTETTLPHDPRQHFALRKLGDRLREVIVSHLTVARHQLPDDGQNVAE